MWITKLEIPFILELQVNEFLGSTAVLWQRRDLLDYLNAYGTFCKVQAVQGGGIQRGWDSLVDLVMPQIISGN